MKLPNLDFFFAILIMIINYLVKYLMEAKALKDLKK